MPRAVLTQTWRIRAAGIREQGCYLSNQRESPWWSSRNREETLAHAGSLSRRHRLPSRYASLELAAGRPGFRTLGSTANVEAAAGAFASPRNASPCRPTRSTLARGRTNLTSRRHQTDDAETAYPADGSGYAEDSDGILPAELGSDETAPDAEIPAGPAWDEQQAMPTAFADAVASEPLDARQCPIGSDC
jgi:hypothetical protein